MITYGISRMLLIKVPWLSSLAELSVLMLWADNELMLEVLDIPWVEGGVDGTEGMTWGVLGGGGVAFLLCVLGTATFMPSLFESPLLLTSESELFRKSKSKSSSRSFSFFGRTKPDKTLAGIVGLLPESEIPSGLLVMLAVPASTVTLDFLMLPAAAEM